MGCANSLHASSVTATRACEAEWKRRRRRRWRGGMNGGEHESEREGPIFHGRSTSINPVMFEEPYAEDQVSPGNVIQPTRMTRLHCGQLPSPTATPLRLLIAFGREDATGEAFRTAACHLGCECMVERSKASVVQAYQELQPHLVIIDRRHPKCLDADELCRFIRSSKGGKYTVILAVVRKGFPDKATESSIMQFLNIGYDRWLIETSSLGSCLAEIIQADLNDVALKQQIATTQTLLIALDNCREIVHVTDTSHKIQYVNKASERLIGYRLEEAIGRNLLHGNGSEDEVMTQQLLKGHSWEGSVTCRRQMGDLVALHCRITPVSISSRTPSHLVWVHEPPLLLTEKALAEVTTDGMYPLPRGSLRSIRKASYDIKSLNSDGSQFIRRQSLAKLHALTMEAPITRVMSLIYAAQENCSPQIAIILEKVIDILRSTELYSPKLTEEKVCTDDPVTKDLIGALLSQGNKLQSGRRSSSESTVKSHQGGLARGMQSPNSFMPANIKELLNSHLLWEFDIFKLEKLSQFKPLFWLGLNIFCHYELPQTLNTDERTLQNWLTLIEANYHSANTYHNSTHAADVLQATAVFLEHECLKEMLDPLDEAACLIAAAVHDIDHPGKSSAFLCNSNNELAILYNDLSVLESHHSALAFKLTLSDDRVNIFKGLEREKFKIIRQSIIDMVLATEMTKHFEHMTKFVNVFTKPAARDEEGFSMEVACDASDYGNLNSPENIALAKRMLIKCADVSNPSRPLKLYVEWTRRIAEEYFNQTDEEKANNLPVVMPVFDRATCSIPKSQIGFVDFIINDMFEAWGAFIDMPELIDNMKDNYQYWKEKETMGVTTIEELAEAMHKS